MKPYVLIIDDDALAGVLRCSLEDEGFDAVEAHDGDEALACILRRKPDIVLLDSIVPTGSCADMRGRIRAAPDCRSVPIVTMVPGDMPIQRACDPCGGLDECIRKPFGIIELLARIRAVMRSKGAFIRSEILCVADLTLDLDAHRAVRGGRAIHLGPTEYRLLCFFMEHPGRLFSRASLLDAIWGRDAKVDPRSVDVYVNRLRKLLNLDDEPDLIRTVRSAGYAMDGESPAATEGRKR